MHKPQLRRILLVGRMKFPTQGSSIDAYYTSSMNVPYLSFVKHCSYAGSSIAKEPIELFSQVRQLFPPVFNALTSTTAHSSQGLPSRLIDGTLVMSLFSLFRVSRCAMISNSDFVHFSVLPLSEVMEGNANLGL